MAARIVEKSHELFSGVDPKLGGSDEGMSPHRILEAALAACTIITVQMYANRKGMKLDSTNVKVHIESEGKETKLSRIVEFKGALTTEEKDRLLEIANKCPIHNLLESHVTIETTISTTAATKGQEA
ncbi:MAG: OsmC family protein [Bdellovibrionales bacterium]|nr:OsmC family protein [Bdellovibrionales bacterium]